MKTAAQRPSLKAEDVFIYKSRSEEDFVITPHMLPYECLSDDEMGHFRLFPEHRIEDELEDSSEDEDMTAEWERTPPRKEYLAQTELLNVVSPSPAPAPAPAPVPFPPEPYPEWWEEKWEDGGLGRSKESRMLEEYERILELEKSSPSGLLPEDWEEMTLSKLLESPKSPKTTTPQVDPSS